MIPCVACGYPIGYLSRLQPQRPPWKYRYSVAGDTLSLDDLDPNEGLRKSIAISANSTKIQIVVAHSLNGLKSRS